MQKEYWNSVRVYFRRYNKDELIKILKEKSELLAKQIPIVKVILFGSYAKGNATAASDVDVFVVHKCSKNINAYSVVWDSLYVPQLELHVYHYDVYRKMKEERNSLVNVVEKEGIVIYTSE